MCFRCFRKLSIFRVVRLYGIAVGTSFERKTIKKKKKEKRWTEKPSKSSAGVIAVERELRTGEEVWAGPIIIIITVIMSLSYARVIALVNWKKKKRGKKKEIPNPTERRSKRSVIREAFDGKLAAAHFKRRQFNAVICERQINKYIYTHTHTGHCGRQRIVQGILHAARNRTYRVKCFEIRFARDRGSSGSTKRFPPTLTGITHTEE